MKNKNISLNSKNVRLLSTILEFKEIEMELFGQTTSEREKSRRNFRELEEDGFVEIEEKDPNYHIVRIPKSEKVIIVTLLQAWKEFEKQIKNDRERRIL